MFCMVYNYFSLVIVIKSAFSIYYFDVKSLYNVCTTNFYLFLNIFMMMNKQAADFAEFSQYSTGLIYVEKTLKM